VQFGKKWATPEALNSFRRTLEEIMNSFLEAVKPKLAVDTKSAQV
jgi:hypothetical protein